MLSKLISKLNFSSQSSNHISSINKNLKQKLNQLFKKTHPDSLQGKCSEEEISLNSKSIQEINLFVNSLKDNLFYSGKEIDLYVLSSNKEQTASSTKHILSLPSLKKGNLNHSQSIEFFNRVDEILNESSIENEKSSFKFGFDTENSKVKPRGRVFKQDEIKSIENTRAILTEMKEERSQYKLIKKENLYNLNVSKHMKTDKKQYNALISWAKKQTKDYKDLYQLTYWLYPYENICFDEELSSDDIDLFITNLRSFDINSDENKELNEVYSVQKDVLLKENIKFLYIKPKVSEQVKSNENDLFDKGYYSKSPGYICLPVNFKLKDLVSYLNLSGKDVIRIKHEYDNNMLHIKQTLDLLKSLKINVSFEKIDDEIGRKDRTLYKKGVSNLYIDYSYKLMLCIKRIYRIVNLYKDVISERKLNVLFFIDNSKDDCLQNNFSLFEVDDKIVFNVGLKFENEDVEKRLYEVLYKDRVMNKSI